MKLHTPSALLGAILVSVLTLTVAFITPQVPVECCLTPAQQDILDLLSVEYIDDCVSGPGYKTLRVTGANLQVVNGLGTTDTVNGLGNLIVGYNDLSALCDHSGSHNIIAGIGAVYPSYGTLNVGYDNSTLSPMSVAFGNYNSVDSGAPYAVSTILGGDGNVINNGRSTIVAGLGNTVTLSSSSYTGVILGGSGNTVSADAGVLVGGQFNTTSNVYGVTIGGSGNTNQGDHAVLVGGKWNSVTGSESVLSGGLQRSSTGQHDWVAGSLFEDQ